MLIVFNFFSISSLLQALSRITMLEALKDAPLACQTGATVAQCSNFNFFLPQALSLITTLEVLDDAPAAARAADGSAVVSLPSVGSAQLAEQLAFVNGAIKTARLGIDSQVTFLEVNLYQRDKFTIL